VSSMSISDFAKYWAGLHFEQRQSIWNGFHRTFRQLHGRNDRPQVWEIWVDKDRYYTRHGLLGGKMQETSKLGKYKNQGKSNEITPEQDALAEARRLTRKKWDFEGYDEFTGEVNIDQRSGTPSIPHLLSSLPGSFSMYKPQNSLDSAPKLLKKANENRVWYALKRNGLAFWVVIDSQKNVQMYSRRNRPTHKDEGPRENLDGTLDYSTFIPWTVRFSHLVGAVSLLELPPNTMLCCELVHPEGDTKRHFSHVQGVEKSLTPRALELQAESGYLGLYCWDIPFWDGQDLVRTSPVGSRYKLINDVFDAQKLREMSTDIAQKLKSHGASMPSDWVKPVLSNLFPGGLDSAVAHAKEKDLEGWVVVDPEGVYGDKGWNLKGKPDRPSSFCAKLKPWYEDDFVAVFDPVNKWGTWGKGRHEKGKTVTLPNGNTVIHGGIGSVGLGQYNSNGDLVYICDCSSGMEYEYQAQLRPEHFPQVWEVKYVERSYQSDGDDTNALTFPGLVRVREDKSPEECVNPQLDE
jgi:hypothetical protein